MRKDLTSAHEVSPLPSSYSQEAMSIIYRPISTLSKAYRHANCGRHCSRNPLQAQGSHWLFSSTEAGDGPKRQAGPQTRPGVALGTLPSILVTTLL